VIAFFVFSQVREPNPPLDFDINDTSLDNEQLTRKIRKLHPDDGVSRLDAGANQQYQQQVQYHQQPQQRHPQLGLLPDPCHDAVDPSITGLNPTISCTRFNDNVPSPEQLVERQDEFVRLNLSARFATDSHGIQFADTHSARTLTAQSMVDSLNAILKQKSTMDSKPTADAKSVVDEFAQAEYDSADALPFKFDSSDGDVAGEVAIAAVPSVVNQESKGKSIDTLKKTLKSRRKPVINSKSPSQDVEIDANGSPRGSTTHGDNLTPTNADRKRKLSTRGQEFRKFLQAERRGLFDDDESLQDGEETAPRLNDVLEQFGAGDATYTEPRRYTSS
jgi:hypothetical protein